MADIVGTIQTENTAFNTALDHLRTYHLCQHWDNGQIALYLFQRPVGVRSQKLWAQYVSALSIVLTVGAREGWTTPLRGRNGTLDYLLLRGELEAQVE